MPSQCELRNRTIGGLNILLTPARIGEIEIKNRVVMPAMTTRTADEDGSVTDDTIAYYMARVRGGTGLITVEMAAPEKAGRHRRRELRIHDDRFLQGLMRLVAEIHRGGAKASIQLGHAGGHTRIDICGETPLAPSAVPHPVFEVTFEKIVPQAMSRSRIAQTVQAFADAAVRARKAGFDCVEIHAAHGYLISQFHAPFENVRTDDYGGSLANRARFGLEVLSAVKAAAPDIGVIYRLSVEDFFPQGLHFAEGKEIAIAAAKAGADALHISAGHYRSLPSAHVMIPPMGMREAPFLDFAAEVKKSVDVPVIAVGRLGDPEIAMQAVASGRCDFIALGRSLIADPQWVEKLRRAEAPRRCLACNTCVDEMRAGARIGCVVNAAAGREREFADASLPKGERIAVIGAGPAGLTYASLVAETNRVTVFEREHISGGALRLAAKAPLFQDVDANEQSLARYIEALVDACRRKGVEFQFGTDVSAKPDLLLPFDRIVIATGADYRFGLAPIVSAILRSGAARWRGPAKLLSRHGLRDWFYHGARRPTAQRFAALARPGQTVVAIGDALSPGKTKAAVASAFEAALQTHDR